MKRRSLLLGLLMAVAGCVPVGQGPTSPPLPSSAPTPPARASQGAMSPEPMVTARPRRSPAPTPTTQPTSSEPMPPLAQLRLPDGTLQPAALGSYVYGGAAADGPWLPARVLPAVEVDAGASLVLSVPPLRFVRWGARYADARDEAADIISPLAAGGDNVASMESAVLPAPPSGPWVMMVQLYFADEAGDAAYYWHVVVP